MNRNSLKYPKILIVCLVAMVVLSGCSSAQTIATIKDFAWDLATVISGAPSGPEPDQGTGQDSDSGKEQEPGNSSGQPDDPDANQDPGSSEGSPNPASGSDQSPTSGDNPAKDEPAKYPEPRDPLLVRKYYTQDGEPPLAPGLYMQYRKFKTEPEKIVYLTIDDGPHPNTTPKIIEILKQEQVPATFFVIGRMAEKYPELIKAEYEAGYAIGNHSYSHDYQEIYQSPEAFLQSIKQTEAVLEKIIGETPKIIRAPGGTHTHFNVDYYNLLDSQGYLVYDWNVSIGDTAAPLVPTKTLIANLQSQMPGKNRAIILMHDAGGKSTTVEALPEIIRYLKQNGYSFGVLSPEVMPILFSGGFSQ